MGFFHKVFFCIGKKGKKTQSSQKNNKNQKHPTAPSKKNAPNHPPNQTVSAPTVRSTLSKPVRRVASETHSRRVVTRPGDTARSRRPQQHSAKQATNTGPWSGTQFIKTAPVKNEETCWSRFKDDLHYRLIRLRVRLKGKKKPDVLTIPNYDPFTGEPVLTGAERPHHELEEEAETEVKCLTYSKELHSSLKYFWWAVSATGRLPFRVTMDGETLTVSMEYLSISFIVNLSFCLILWGLLLWMSAGFFMLKLDSKIPGIDFPSSSNFTKAQKEAKSLRVEYRLFKRYWLELWFFYTTFFHLACITTHQCIYGKSYALYFKRWYKALDRSKVMVHESLQQFYLMLYVLGLAVILIMISVYCARYKFPATFRTIQLILALFMYPFQYGLDEHLRRDKDGYMYFENVGLEVLIFMLYCLVVIMAWINSIIHLTFSRCFRNGIRLLNERVKMILLPFEEPQIGPNAVRITPQFVQADYADLTAAGMEQNKVFGFALLSDMMWTLYTIFSEVMVLTFYGFVDPAHPEFTYRLENTYENTKIDQMEPAWPYFINSVGHILITGSRLWIVIWLPDLVFREALIGYRYATQKGLILCENQTQRNLVRSMWLMTVPKFPVMITANYYFKLSRGMICALLAAVVTYYIFAMQAKDAVARIILGDWEEDIDTLYFAATGEHITKD